MNQLSEQDMRLHVTILGWLFIVGHAFFLALAALMFLFFTGIGAVSGDAQAVVVLGVIGTVGGGFMVVLAIPGLIAGFGLLAHKSWARILGIVLGLLNLLNFPLGTILGLYAVWVLFQEAATPYFALQPAA